MTMQWWTPDGSAGLFFGDCRDVLPEFGSMDTVITDPPYGLDFMGKDWDHGVPGVEFWEAISRAAKPGAQVVAFGGTRTLHRLTCAIEDAGIEIRDCLMWLYGSGFPKSQNVGKAMDRRRFDDPRPACRFLRAAIDASPYTVKDIAERFGFHSRMVDHWAARDTDGQPTIPKWDQWLKLKHLLHFDDTMDDEVYNLNGRKGTLGEDWEKREVVGTYHDAELVYKPGESIEAKRVEIEITEGATEESRRWGGHGTQLKPAWEPAILGMVPMPGGFAANAETFGVAGLNIDAARFGKEQRWPSNLIIDEDSGRVLDEATGKFVSRFFYTAKASKAERGPGNVHPTVKPISLMRYLCDLTAPPGGGYVLDPFMGSGSTGIASLESCRKFIGIEKDPAYFQIAKRRILEAWENMQT